MEPFLWLANEGISFLTKSLGMVQSFKKENNSEKASDKGKYEEANAQREHFPYPAFLLQ